MESTPAAFGLTLNHATVCAITHSLRQDLASLRLCEVDACHNSRIHVRLPCVRDRMSRRRAVTRTRFA
jgi:hypothetical protein